VRTAKIIEGSVAVVAQLHKDLCSSLEKPIVRMCSELPAIMMWDDLQQKCQGMVDTNPNDAEAFKKVLKEKGARELLGKVRMINSSLASARQVCADMSWDFDGKMPAASRCEAMELHNAKQCISLLVLIQHALAKLNKDESRLSRIEEAERLASDSKVKLPAVFLTWARSM
jgi:hypothetical protein